MHLSHSGWNQGRDLHPEGFLSCVLPRAGRPLPWPPFAKARGLSRASLPTLQISSAPRTRRSRAPTLTPANHPFSGFPLIAVSLPRVGRARRARRWAARDSNLAWRTDGSESRPYQDATRAARGAAPTWIQADAMSSHPYPGSRLPSVVYKPGPNRLVCKLI